MVYYREMSQLLREDIIKLASLARLGLDENEISSYQHELNAILAYVEQLGAVDVSDLEPTAQVTGLQNVTRPDELIDYGYTREDLLSIVPVVQDEHIKVQRMIG